MRPPRTRFSIFRRATLAFAHTAALLSCGREPTTPSAESIRFARALALSPAFPPAFQQTPGAFALAPFTQVRAEFVRASGVVALDTLIAFPATSDSLSLSFTVPLSADAPVAGEPLTVFLYCMSAQGDTVFKGGPVTAFAVPSAGATLATAISIPLSYMGPGASATSVHVAPKNATVTSGDPFVFSATALDQNGQPVAAAPIMFRIVDTSLAVLGSPASGAGRAAATHGSTFVIAQLVSGKADTATLTVQAKTTTGTAPAVATKLAFASQPVNVIAGSAFAPGISVNVEDALGNIVTAFNGAVTLSLGAAPTGATLSGTTTVNAVAGIATFTTASLSKAAVTYRLVASAAGLASDSSSIFAVGAAGAAKISVSSGAGQTGTAAAPLGTPLAVAVTDIFGNPVNAFTVNWTVTSGGGSLGSSTSITGATGITTNSWALGPALGTQTVAASASGLVGSPVAFDAQSTAGVATKLVLSAAPTSAVAGVAIGSIVVQAKDGLNNIQPSFSGNVTISLGANPGGASLGGTTTVAAVAGIATFSDLSIKKAAAGYTLVASSGSLTTDASPMFTVNAAAATNLAISGGGTQSGSILAPLATPLSVTVTDAFANPVSLVNVSFAVTTGGGTLSSTTVPTSAAGIATTVWTLGAAIGTQNVTATAAGVTGSAASFSATAIAGGAAHLAITTQPASAVAGMALAPAIVVQAKDASGNPATSFAGSVSLSLGANPGSATLSGTTTVSAVGGIATFSGLSLNKAATGYKLVAGAAGLSADTSATFAITNAAASALSAVSGSGQTGLVASALPAPLVTIVNDAFGNPVAGVSVAWAATGGGGSISPNTSVTNALGMANATWTLGAAAGAGTATATVVGLTGSPVSFAATGFASAATKLTIVSEPSNVVAGAAIAPAIVVQARDASNNLVSAFNGSVALSLGANPAGAVLGGTTTVSASGGVATFAGVTLSKAGAGVTLVASAGGLTSDNSGTFSVTNAAAATLSIAGGSNQAGAVSAALATPLSVMVTDALSNPVSGINVSWSVSTGGGSLGVTSSVTNASGIATDSWTLGALAGAQTVTASASGLAGSPAIFSATAAAGVATKLVITSQPATTIAGVNLAPSLIATAEDAAGNLATTFTGPVTVSLTTNPGSATLSGTTTVNAVAGVATFSGISLNKAASGYRVSVSSGSLSQDTSVPLTIGAAAAASLAVNGGNAQSGAISLALATPLSVAVTDAFGNAVAGVAVSWNVATGGGSLGNATTTTNSSGIATNSWTLGSLVGGQSVSASASGLAGSPVTFSATASAGAATKLVIASQPVGGAAGAGIGLLATAEDASGNVVTAFTGAVSITFGTNPGSGTIGGSTTVNAVAGIATFSNLSVVKAAAGYTLVAGASGLASATSSAFDVFAAAPASISITSGNNQSGQIALALSSALAVTVVDAYANPVPNVTVNWSIGSGGGSLGSSTAQTNASGMATDNWTLGALLGTQTVSATASGVASPVTFSATGLVGSAVSLVMSAVPATTIAGALLGPSITVTAKDLQGNTVTSFTGAISLAFGSNPGGATLAGTTSINAVAGVASFTNLSIVKAAAGYTLVASTSGLTSATSTSVTITAAAAATLSVASGNNQTSVVAQILGTPLAVLVTDQYGNPVPSVSVTWGIASGGGSLGSLTSQTNSSGLATNASWTLGTGAGAQSVTATVAGITGSPAAFGVTSIAAAAVKLVLSSLPGSSIAGVNFGSTIIATAEDLYNNVATTFTSAVSLAFGANPGGGSLGGTTSVNAVSGVATFSNVFVTKAATGYTLAASASGLTGITSNSFSIGAAAAAAISVVSGNNQSGLLSILGILLPTPLSVLVADAFGNPVSGYTVSWSVTLGNAQLGTTTSQTSSSGVATNSLTLLGLLGGLRQITATAAGVAGSAIFSATGL